MATSALETRNGQLRVVVACPGVGRVRRGYESFAEGLFEALNSLPKTTASLLQGVPPAKKGARYRVRHLRADGRAARLVSKVFRVAPLTIERLSFAIGSVCRLARLRPDVVVSSEREVCAAYARLQWWPLAQFAVVLNNGGNHHPPFPRVDTVKHSSPTPMTWALDAGENPAAHAALEEGVGLPPADLAERAEARHLLGLPADAFVVLSVGLLDLDYFKRMEFVANEAADSGLDPFLVLLGQRDPQTPALEALVNRRFPARNRITNVAPEQISLYYRAADVLASASMREGFGRVFAEALVHGLPVIAHDDPVTRWVVGGEGVFIDTTVPGSLASALRDLAGHPIEVDTRGAAARFGWNELAPRYRGLLVNAVEIRRLRGRSR